MKIRDVISISKAAHLAPDIRLAAKSRGGVLRVETEPIKMEANDDDPDIPECGKAMTPVFYIPGPGPTSELRLERTMITLQTILDRLDLKILTKTREFSAIPINSGYASDILSCVMSGVRANCIWVTLIANINIVAVASLLGIPAILLTEDAQPDEETIARANQEEITLLSTPENSYRIIGELWQMGIKDDQAREPHLRNEKTALTRNN